MEIREKYWNDNDDDEKIRKVAPKYEIGILSVPISTWS